jgi:3-deoxy-manno-octulosonate cytidylyltransferase (CMP-KDO synthetase)
MRDTVIIIPSRLDSTRIPGKALIEIEGKPLIRNVLDRCLETGIKTYVATDSTEIADVLYDENVILTGESDCGTDRVAQAAKTLGLTNGDWIINVQGDKLVEPECIEWFSKRLEYNHNSYHTLYCMHEEREGGVRVLVNREGFATHFTRQDLKGSQGHCGIYGYTGAFLQRFVGFPREWASFENLEQMRVLEEGCEVRCFGYPGFSGHSINYVEDICHTTMQKAS